MILNSAAPTAERDDRLADVIRTATSSLQTGAGVRLETVTIDDLDDVSSAVSSLVNRGVTVIATSCDDSSMPSVVDAAIDAELLAVTGCVTIPRPDLMVDSDLFIDLAGLNDSPGAIARWASIEDFQNMAIISSELIPDVSNTCSSLESSLPNVDIDVAVSTTFTELVDDTRTVVSAVADQLVEVDAIAICALAPSLGDLVFSLREAGFEQPVVVPWFGDNQQWIDGTNNVFAITPASRFGDDPIDEVAALFEQLDDPEAVDVVAVDTVAILARAADNAGAVGSVRLAEAIRTQTNQGVSGPLSFDEEESTTRVRSYRVIEVIDGEPVFQSVVSEDGLVRFGE